MPTLHLLFLVVFDDPFDLVQLFPAEACRTLQSRRTQPVLRFVVIALHMHMRGFVTISCVKEKTIRSYTKHSRHGGSPPITLAYFPGALYCGTNASSAAFSFASRSLDSFFSFTSWSRTSLRCSFMYCSNCASQPATS